jgi:hypothetical protein
LTKEEVFFGLFLAHFVKNMKLGYKAEIGHISASNKKTKGTFFSPTLKAKEKKMPLFF